MFQRDLWPLFDGLGESLHVNPLKNALVHVVWDFLNPDSHNIPAGNSPCFKVWTLERTSLCVHTGSDWIFWFLWSPSDVHKESGVTLPPPLPPPSAIPQLLQAFSRADRRLVSCRPAPVLLTRSPPRHHSAAVWPDLATAGLVTSETENTDRPGRAGQTTCRQRKSSQMML